MNAFAEFDIMERSTIRDICGEGETARLA